MKPPSTTMNSKTATPKGPKNDSRKQVVDSILQMKVGDSFFLEGATRRDLETYRKHIVALGGNIEIVQVQKDEIYQLPGVRCWRRAGIIDEL